MRAGKIKKEKRPAYPAVAKNKALRADTTAHIVAKQDLLTEMDADEILAVYRHRVTDRGARKNPEMKVSGKSVFKIKEIIVKKYKDSEGKN